MLKSTILDGVFGLLTVRDVAIVAVYVVAFGVVPASVFWLTGWLGDWRRPANCVLAGLLAILAVAATVYELPDSKVSSVRFDEANELRLAQNEWTTVQGSVEPPEARVVVLVHSAEDNKWWVQDLANVIHGAWEARINLGTKKVGAGKQFQVVAVASTNSWFLDVLKGYWLWPGTTVSRPPSLPGSDVVSIWRSQ